MTLLLPTRLRRTARALACAALAAAALVTAACSSSSSSSSDALTTDAIPEARPNILFVMMDDVGIDQLQKSMLGLNAPGLPSTPTIETLADNGVRFQDTWSTPACSSSRATIFEGRFPLRHRVSNAIGMADLANSMTSPYTVTVPKLLAGQGYQSALFGKFHIALPQNHPAGDGLVRDLGWDHFAGWLDPTGDPESIDTTAGGIAPEGTYSCGFVPSSRVANGADSGACRMPDGTCTDLSAGRGEIPPGLACLQRGGLLEPNATCSAPASPKLDFTRQQSHWVSPLVYNLPDGTVNRVPMSDPNARKWRGDFVVDAAIEWIKGRPAGQPWMATVSFASMHTPLVPPPAQSDWPASIAAADLDCTNPLHQREIGNLMVESMDRGIARLLVSTGLATRNADGSLSYTPAASNTMIVLVTDNGSLGNTVKLPFDPTRAKSTAYQTGVWVPLIVAGPLVNTPGRAVTAMVNIADLYALFGEVAGLSDVQAAVSQPLDARPMLPYLKDPQQAPIRDLNYAEIGPTIQAGGGFNAPCVVGNSCTQLPSRESVCKDNGGTWWGPGTTASVNGVRAPSEGFQYCCQASAFIAANGGTPPTIQPLGAVAVRTGPYKLVQNSVKNYVSPSQACVDQTVNEYYEISTVPGDLRLDREGDAIPEGSLTATQKSAFDGLLAQLASIRASQPACPGDGNGDLVVDAKDLEGWVRYSTVNGGRSSVFDLDYDGLTNANDRTLIVSNLGRDCRAAR